MYQLMRPLFLLLLFLLSLNSRGQINRTPEQLSRLQFDSITNVLENVYEADQGLRAAIDTIALKFGNNSEEMKHHWRKIRLTDSINLQIVCTIVDTYGWLSEEEISVKAHDAQWLVIQHSDLATQLKYLPLLEAAMKTGKVKAKRYAYLFDRILTAQGKFQIYGSQFQVNPSGKTYVYPIADEPHVNQRRREVGLDPLEIVAKEMGLDYQVPTEDPYKDKIVIMGLVVDAAYKPIESAVISLADKMLVKTDKNGEYFIVIDKKQKDTGLQLKKVGYQTAVIALREDKDVFEAIFVMSK